MKLLKKRCFTLLELLVVLFIMSLGAILTGVNISKSFKEQRFLSEVQQVVSHIQMAQDLILVLDTDVKIQFWHDQEHETIRYQLSFEKPLKPRWRKIVESEHELKAIKCLVFNGQRINSGEKIVLEFFSKGIPMSSGKLFLFPDAQGEESVLKSDEKNKMVIELKGYPHPIESKPYKESTLLNTSTTLSIGQELYPKKHLEEPNDKKTP